MMGVGRWLDFLSMKFVCPREINGGSNYDSLKVAKCLVISLVTYPHEWIKSSVPSVPIYYLAKPQARFTGLGVFSRLPERKLTLSSLDSSLTL